MRFDHEKPIFLQIKKEICRWIARGKLEAGEKAHSMRDMALELQVNPNTVQRAYRELEAEGILFTRRGQGTFVTEDAAKIARLKTELAEEATKAFMTEASSLGLTRDEIVILFQEVMEEEGL